MRPACGSHLQFSIVLGYGQTSYFVAMVRSCFSHGVFTPVSETLGNRFSFVQQSVQPVSIIALHSAGRSAHLFRVICTSLAYAILRGGWNATFSLLLPFGLFQECPPATGDPPSLFRTWLSMSSTCTEDGKTCWAHSRKLSTYTHCRKCESSGGYGVDCRKFLCGDCFYQTLISENAGVCLYLPNSLQDRKSVV